MTARRSIAAIATFAAALVLLAPAGALAQVVENPPPVKEVGEVDNWTFVVMPLLAALAVLVVLVVAVGYVVKSREFKANQRRGGSK